MHANGYYLLNNHYPIKYHLNLDVNPIPERTVYTITDFNEWIESDLKICEYGKKGKIRISSKAEYPFI